MFSSESTVAELAAQERLLDAIDGAGLDVDELDAILKILPVGEDDAFGLAWMALHKIEASPHWPTAALDSAAGVWADVLRQRISDAADLA